MRLNYKRCKMPRTRQAVCKTRGVTVNLTGAGTEIQEAGTLLVKSAVH